MNEGGGGGDSLFCVLSVCPCGFQRKYGMVSRIT